MARNIVITLLVEIQDLFNGGILDNLCEFKDDYRGSYPGGVRRGKPKEFTSEVFGAKKVTWDIQLDGINSQYFRVTEAEIITNEGSQIFADYPLQSSGKKVSGMLNDYEGSPKEIKYDISFKVIRNQTHEEKTFLIDPKLKINPSA